MLIMTKATLLAQMSSFFASKNLGKTWPKLWSSKWEARLRRRNLFHSRMKENQWAFDGNFKAFLPWRFQLRGVKGEFYAQPLPPLSWHRIMNLAFSIAKKFKPQKRGMHFIHHPCRKEIFHLIFGGKSPLRHLVVEGWSNCITIPTSNQHWTFTLCVPH